MNEQSQKMLQVKCLKKKKNLTVLIDIPEKLIALDGGWGEERKVEEKMKKQILGKGTDSIVHRNKQ